MPAFSRGISTFFHPHALRLPSSLRATLHNTRLQAPRIHPRNQPFSSSILRRYAYAARSPSSPSQGSYYQSDPVLRTVFNTRQPVLLYKEPPRRPYLTKVYAWALTATAIGAYNFYWTAHLPNGLQFFVAPTYVIIGLAFCAIGISIFQRPVRRLSTLEVIPGYGGGRLQVRLRGKKAPWARDEVVETDIWDATISEKTVPVITEIVEAERARKQNITQGLEHMSILPKMWEIAARWVEQKWTSFFLRFKFAVLQFGIVHVEVDGVKWKIDCTGYLREDGQAIDRIIPVE